jgi:hypothetical protein
MPAMLILAAGVMGLVLVVLVVVVVGIRQEPSAQELAGQAPRLIARLVRRVLRVYVRRPDPSVSPDLQRREPSRAAHGPRHADAAHRTYRD